MLILSESARYKYWSADTETYAIVITGLKNFLIGLFFTLLTLWVFLIIAKTLFKLKYLLYSITLVITSIAFVITDYYISKSVAVIHLVPLDRSLTALYTLRNMVTIMGFTSLFLVIKNLKEIQKHKRDALEAKQLATEAQLQMLQSQINPHFFFNVLNSVRSLITSDTAKARDMLTNISELLRRILQNKDIAEVPISDELEALYKYVDIQKVRFGSRLQISYSINKDVLNLKIPTFILQPLVENAIKHGMKSGKVLYVDICAVLSKDEFKIAVINNGEISENHAMTGLGNTNIKNRLDLIYKNKVDFNVFESDGKVHSEIIIRN